MINEAKNLVDDNWH